MPVTTITAIITPSIPSMMMTQRFSVRATSSSGTIPPWRGRCSGLGGSSANWTSRQEEEEIKHEPTNEEQPHRDRGDQQRAARAVLERLGGGIRSDRSGHVLWQMSGGPMRRIDIRGNRFFNLCRHPPISYCDAMAAADASTCW